MNFARQALTEPQVSEEMVQAARQALAKTKVMKWIGGQNVDDAVRAALEAALSTEKELATPALPVAPGSGVTAGETAPDTSPRSEGEAAGGERRLECSHDRSTKCVHCIDAFARGAAAMQKLAARRASTVEDYGSDAGDVIADAIRALPLPTEPKP